MEELIKTHYESFKGNVEEISAKYDLIKLQQECIFDDPELINIANKQLTEIANANLTIDKLGFINIITCKFLLKLYEELNNEMKELDGKPKLDNGEDEDMEEEEDDEEQQEILLKVKSLNEKFMCNIFILLDYAIYINSVKDYNSYSTQTLNTILVYFCSTGFLLSTFAPYFFSKENESRRLQLTEHNKLVGKNKAGSRLLSIYHNVVPRLPITYMEDDLFTQNLRSFISDAFEISDKLSLSQDWNLSEFQGIYDIYTKSKVFANLTGKSSQRKSPEDFIFKEYMLLMKYITTTSVQEMIHQINQSNDNNKRLNIIDRINNLSSRTNSPNFQETIKMPLSNNYEPDWTLDPESFKGQIKTHNQLWSFRLQLLILMNFLKQTTFDKWSSTINEVSKEFSKFRKPDSLTNPIASPYSKRLIRETSYSCMKPFKANKFHEVEIDQLLSVNEKTWTKMKLKQFSHPDLKSLQELSNDKKRKYEDFLNDTDADEIRNKKPYLNKMGTAKITKLWKVKTGLDNLKNKVATAEEILESVKDDIYFVKGRYFDLKNDEAAKPQDLVESEEEYRMLNWKGLKSARECGQWMTFSQCDDGDIGVNGLWDADLIKTEE